MHIFVLLNYTICHLRFIDLGESDFYSDYINHTCWTTVVLDSPVHISKKWIWLASVKVFRHFVEIMKH